jgi:hypothetical protein
MLLENKMNYQLAFLFLDDRQMRCHVSIKDKRKTWIGVSLFVPGRLPIWFAYNKLTGQIRHGKKLRVLQYLFPVAYGRVIKNLEGLQ